MMMILIFVLFFVMTVAKGQHVGEVKDTTSETYRFGSLDSQSESQSEESFSDKDATFKYQEDSFEDLTSREDPLLLPPRQDLYNGPWDYQRQEISISGPISGLSNLNPPRRDYPINIPHLPSFGPIIPYPAFNSRSLQNDGFLPSTYASTSSENVQLSQDNNS